MIEYEINYLVLQSKTKDLEKIRKKVKELISKAEAKITGEINYQKRKLAYEIKHELYGFYTVLRFQTKNKEIVEKITQELNIDPEIARFIIVRADELPSLKEEGEKLTEEKKDETVVKQEELDKILEKQKDGNKKITAEESLEKEISEKDLEETLPDNPQKTSTESADKKSDSEIVSQKSEPEEDKKQKASLKSKEEKKINETDSPVSQEKSKKEDQLKELDEKLDEILNI